MYTAQDVVKQLCILGITAIEVDWDSKKGMLRYDLKTRAKSHLHLYEDLSLCGRYGRETKVDKDQALDSIIEDLFWEFKGCLHGRDYYNLEWMELGVKLGLVEKKTTLSTSYA